MATREVKLTPRYPYDCWCIPCYLCVYWDDEKVHCNHPEKDNL